MSFSTTSSVFGKRHSRKTNLSILVCGASGTGKSSFINTFIGYKVIYGHEDQSGYVEEEPLRFVPTTVELDTPLADGSRLVLTMIETEHFGRALNHADDVEKLASYIECRFDEVLAEESRIRRNPRFKDNRIDVCLYFIEPTSHGLKELDLLTLKRISSIVNVVPVLARADSLTPQELVANKRLVSEDLKVHDIPVFDFRYVDEHNQAGEETELYSAIPFSVTSSSEFGEKGDAKFIRKLPHGLVQVLDPKHSEFKLLRDALLDDFLTELKDRTHEELYETFRTHRLDPGNNHRASLLMPQELADHAARLKQAQIDRETALLRERERQVNAEIEAKRAVLQKRELELRQLERKMENLRSSQVSNAKFTNNSVVQPEAVNEVPTEPINPADFGTVQLANAEFAPQQTNQSLGSETTPQSSLQQQRIRHSQSKKELREHADQLHAELGNLEQQKQDIQRQVATAESSKSIGIQHDFDAVGSSLPHVPNSFTQSELNKTSPLKIKKATGA